MFCTLFLFEWFIFLTFFSGVSRAESNKETEVFLGQISWYGQGCFLITSKKGVRILIDPPGGLDYPEPEVYPDIVLISHEHPDSNNVKMLKNAPMVIRGLKDGGKSFNPVNLTVKDVRIRNVLSYHDKVGGGLRGLNSIFILKTPNITYIHLGNLGHLLYPEQVSQIKNIAGYSNIARYSSILMLPVGGVAYVLDAKDATEVMKQLSPRITIPMYYATHGNAAMDLDVLQDFLRGKEDKVLRKPPGPFVFDLANLPTFGTVLSLEETIRFPPFKFSWKKPCMACHSKACMTCHSKLCIACHSNLLMVKKGIVKSKEKAL